MFIKYFEQGLSVIPVARNGKNPIIENWTKYCYERASINQVEEWESKKDQLNIGICCGPASNLIILDNDSDDPDLLALCPTSPVRRRGKKGDARAFKYNPKIQSQSFPKLDILSAGRQILVPPSIHPETKLHYIWTTPDTLENFDTKDLPELDLSFLERISPFISSIKIQGGGRNNKLKDIVSAMRFDGKSEFEIVEFIYSWDLSHHKPRLFTDSSEGFKAENEDQARLNALKFVSRVTLSLATKGLINISKNESVIIEEESTEIDESNYFQDYPEPTGLLKNIKDLILSESERHMPNLALGGAIALMSIICANRFRFDQCWTNVYVMNLAPTGAGKSFPQSVIVKILQERLRSNLIGFGGYNSSSAFIKNLKSRRERLDIVDEISGLFSHMKSGGIYQQAIVEEMCKIWSLSNGYFNASEYVERDDSSSCYNPCISILGSSTLDGRKDNLSKGMVVKGLIPRFLIFSHDGYGTPNKKPKLDMVLLDTVCDQIKDILKITKNESLAEKDLLHGPIYEPINVAPGKEDAIEYFETLRLDFLNRIETEKSESIKNMLTRGKEQIMKLSTIHAVGNGRMQIEIQDLVWARKTFDVCIHNATPLVEEAAVENLTEKDMTRVLSLFKKNKKKLLTKAFIYNRLQGLDAKRIDAVLARLVVEGKIFQSESIGSRGPKKSGWTSSLTLS